VVDLYGFLLSTFRTPRLVICPCCGENGTRESSKGPNLRGVDRRSKSAMTRRNPHKQAIAGKKKPTGEPVGFLIWWSWGDLNPRPQAFFVQFYMCSRLIWISPDVPRSDTLHTPPVPLDLTPPQGTRGGASPYVLPCSLDGLATALAQPIGQLLQGSPV